MSRMQPGVDFAVGGVRAWRGAIPYAVVLGVVTLGGTLPIPLYRDWSARFHFGPLVTTVIFVAYVVGVLVALLGAGGASDRAGRRPTLVAALVLAGASTAVFFAADGVALLLIGRVLSGLATGVAAAAATAALGEVVATGRRAGAISTAANIGGLGAGVVAAGAVVQHLPDPSRLVFALYAVALLLALGAVLGAAETVTDRVRPVLRIRRPSLPAGRVERRAFLGAATMTSAGFGVNGFFSSLAPAFVRDTLSVADELLVAIGVGLIFIVALVAQLLVPRALSQRLSAVLAALLLGTVLLAVALAAGSAALFVLATALAGSGIGLAFRRGLEVVDRVSTSTDRAGVSATYLLAAYLGLIAPSIALGVLTQTSGQAVAVAVLVVIVAAPAIVGAVIVRSSARTSERGTS